MNICVAIRAVFAYIRENRLYVALRALHFFMHPTQWIVCMVVIEFGMGTNGPPSARRMTIFARNRERPVRSLWAMDGAASQTTPRASQIRHLTTRNVKSPGTLDLTSPRVEWALVSLDFEVCFRWPLLYEGTDWVPVLIN